MEDAAKPSKVQALRALFAQNERTVIDGLKVPKNLSSEEISQDESQKTSNLVTNGSDSEPSNTNVNRLPIGFTSVSSSSPTLPRKPLVGPKPIFNKSQNSATNQQGIKSLVSQLEGSNGMYTSKSNLGSANSIKINSSQESVKSLESDISNTICDKPPLQLKLNGETHSTLIKKETLMLTIPSPEVEFKDVVIRKSKAPPKPKRNSLVHTNNNQNTNNNNNNDTKKCEYRRKALPSVDILGAAPLKPIRPNFVTVSVLVDKAPPLPERNECNPKGSDVPYTATAPPPLPDRILSENRQSVPPPRPNVPPPNTKGPPNRPPPTPPLNSEGSPVDEELYCDTMDPERARSLIAEYTEEEECGTRRNSIPIRPKNPPPPPPSQSSYLPSSTSCDDNSQDTQGSSSGHDDIYEEMPCDSNKGPVYSNSKEQKEQERLRKEAEKRSKRELKEKEKHEKMCEKLRKKYGLTGEEIPLDAGTVKCDCRGSKTDLTVHKGETVLILRMENNPVGKWLAKNEKGKIGYVDLANIEVDADSVKSITEMVKCFDPQFQNNVIPPQSWLYKFTSCVRQVSDDDEGDESSSLSGK